MILDIKLRNLVATALFCLFALTGFSQFFPKKNYPQNYFIWPVGAEKSIAANFGELRANHYHMGLDCRTDRRENVNVFAAADGYVAKIKVEPFGFGQAIYINHPNGLTTVYGHLNKFFPELDKYVKEQQYKLKKWRVYLDVPANLFPVKKGAFIALSGNTGGSMGPHTHFEIRDTKTDKVLNPSLFRMPLTDNVPPEILRLAMYDRCISTYEQSPKFIPINKVNGIYTASKITTNTDKVSFAISTIDKYTGSSNPNGVYEAIIYDNEKPVVGFEIDSISYDESRDVNAHIDYKLKYNGGPWVEHLSKLPGYNNSIYKTTNGDGVINIEDGKLHKIKVEVKDANLNTSTLVFEVQRVNASAPKTNTVTSQQRKFFPDYINLFENNNVSFYLPENALYDSIRFRYKETPSASGFTIYQIHDAEVPIHGYFTLKIKGNSNYADKMIMHRFAKKANDYAKATLENGWYQASFREFGNFQLMVDTIPPTITPIGFRDGMNCKGASSIRFSVSDNCEDIQSFTATLDGNWLRFSNDKGKVFVYSFDEMCGPGSHELKIVAEDLVGNVTEKIYHFVR